MEDQSSLSLSELLLNHFDQFNNQLAVRFEKPEEKTREFINHLQRETDLRRRLNLASRALHTRNHSLASQERDYYLDNLDALLEKNNKPGQEQKTDFQNRLTELVLDSLHLSDESRSRIDYVRNLNEWLTFESLRTMVELERELPGSVDFLTKEYGITFYHRFPPEILKEQFLSRFQMGRGYFLIVSGGAEGYPPGKLAFADPEKFNKVFQQCKRLKVPLRVVEVWDRPDFRKKITFLRETHADLQVEIFLFAAHGSTDEISLNGIENSVLNSSDLKGEIGEQIVSLASPGASAVMWSCSTGVEFAQVLSQVIKGKAVGPASPAASAETKVGKENGRLTLSAQEYYRSYWATTTFERMFGLDRDRRLSLEYENGKIVIPFTLSNLSRKTKLNQNEIDALAKMAAYSEIRTAWSALDILTRYVGMVPVGSKEREEVIQHLAQVVSVGKETKVQAFHALCDLLVFFTSWPETLTIPRDFSDPTAGELNVAVRQNAFDPKTALKSLEGMKYILDYMTGKPSGRQSARIWLTEALTKIETSNYIYPEKVQLVNKIKYLLSKLSATET